MYQGLSPSEQDEARQNVINYLRAVNDIADEIAADSDKQDRFRELTGSAWGAPPTTEQTQDTEADSQPTLGI